MKSNKNFFKPLIGLFVLCAMVACRKAPSKPENPDDPKYVGFVPTEQGTPMGTAVHQTIYPAGGTVELPGHEIRIDIPAGALEVATEISIQEVSNTLAKLGIGKSYKLLPENVIFKKAVNIVFDYPEEILNGTEAKYLSLAYQDSKGYWHRMAKTDIFPVPD